MEDLKLVFASSEYRDQLASYRKEMLENDSSLDGCGPLKRCEDIDEYLKVTDSYCHRNTLPKKMVIATQFLCIRKSDNKLVGMIQVRHYFNDYLKKYAGHIGYSVRPSERRRGYASWMLTSVLPFCRSLGHKKVLVCCLKENDGSRRTILKNGGVYDGTVYFEPEKATLERYWVSTERK